MEAVKVRDTTGTWFEPQYCLKVLHWVEVTLKNKNGSPAFRC